MLPRGRGRRQSGKTKTKPTPTAGRTTSAAGPLAVHLARHGRTAWGEEIEISQGAEIARPSTRYARADGSPDRIEKVEVGGAAVIVARGEFRLP